MDISSLLKERSWGRQKSYSAVALEEHDMHGGEFGQSL
jgi:hypothetical protein